MSNAGEQIVEVIKEKELQKISTDVIETVLDTTLKEGVFKELPILSTLFGTYNAATSIQDRLFIKKVLTFLYELKSVPQDERIKQVIKIEDDHKYKTRVGEKILFIINKCDDIDKSAMVGILFKVYLESKINYDEFLACVSCLERAPLPELINFIEGDWDELDTDGGGSELLSYGLMEIRLTKPELKINHNSPYDFQDKYAPSEEEVLESKIELKGFKALCYVTYVGDLLRKYLRNNQS
ncbi:MAG: hypothetical protein IPG86_04040 [Chitinophagaceae bacterium]|nr:hypothetical protein [Chitinophagaceae bacterium]